MGFFGSDDDGSGEADPLDRPTASGVPVGAADRLTELRTSGLFSSTLSANEFALLSELGPQPVAQLLGASVHQVGWQYLPADAQWAATDLFCPLDAVARAWADARKNAFDRLREEAREVGADAVVGVQLRRGKHDWATRAVDFVVSGTGIRLPDADRAARPAMVLSDLSVQDYWKLSGGGWRPTGLLAATSVFFVSQGFGTRWRRRASVTKNQELHEFSDGFAAARRAVVADLRRQARAASADGVVGVSLSYEITSGRFTVGSVGPQRSALSLETVGVGGDMPIGGASKRTGIVMTVHSVGTAIRHTTQPPTPQPQPTLNLGAAL